MIFAEKALFGEDERYFFSPRDRKYPNGERPNRAAASGYWKATGSDKSILTSSESKNIGVKKALVFYRGRAPKGVKTEWTMNEYRLLDRMIKPSRLKGSMRVSRHDDLHDTNYQTLFLSILETVIKHSYKECKVCSALKIQSGSNIGSSFLLFCIFTVYFISIRVKDA